MYRLDVLFTDNSSPRQTRFVHRAGDVLTMIPELLAAHDGCERIVVWAEDSRLFAVDCKGNRVDE